MLHTAGLNLIKIIKLIYKKNSKKTKTKKKRVKFSKIQKKCQKKRINIAVNIEKNDKL